MKSKIKVEFEYVDLNENDIIRFNDEFWRINCQKITDWKDRSYNRVNLTKIKNLKELKLTGESENVN